MGKGKGSKDKKRNKDKKRSKKKADKDKALKRAAAAELNNQAKGPETPNEPAAEVPAPEPAVAQGSATAELVTVDTQAHKKSAQVTGEKLHASQAVVSEWGRRVEAEYRSAAITQHLTLWLIQIAASPDLIHDGLRIVTDELAHAQLSHETFVDAGGQQVSPIARESLALKANPKEPLEAAVTRYAVEVFCLGETVAVPLFKVLREDCVVPSARTALDRILKDEVRHRDFGWNLLEHLLSMPCEKVVRDLVNKELPNMFARIRRSYAPVGGERQTTITKADRGWGLMPIATYGEILEKTLDKEYRPRFAALGFEIDSAWEQACKLHPRFGA